jgi:uncharacterized RDD family membrane protein YckC
MVVRMAGLPLWLALLPLLIYFLYYAAFESSSSQATLGKMALGIKGPRRSRTARSTPRSRTSICRALVAAAERTLSFRGRLAGTASRRPASPSSRSPRTPRGTAVARRVPAGSRRPC